jgi:hypothetical protein
MENYDIKIKVLPLMSPEIAHLLMEGLLTLTKKYSLDRSLTKDEWELKAEALRVAGKYLVTAIEVQS